MSVLRRTYPWAAEVFGQFWDGWEEHFFDAGDALINGILDPMAQGPPWPVAAELRALLQRFPAERDFGRVVQGTAVGAWPVALGWRPWAELAERWARTGLVAGQPLAEVEPGPYPPALPRATRFTSKEVAEAAVTEVLRSHAEQAYAWEAGEPATPRLHLHADLARPVGVGFTGLEQARGEFTGASVVMSRTWRDPTASTAQATEYDGVHVLTAYPEASLDEAVRAAYPDLPHLLGAHFGQDYREETSWGAEVGFHLRATDQTRARMGESIRRLLDDAGDDVEVERCLDALGCYLRPEQPRQWLARLAERFEPALWRVVPPDQR
jgi:hypothetical protein